MIGSQVSHYRLVRKLGSGTYGEVYEGVHVHDDELRVAVKVVSPALAQDARFLDALKRECRQLDKFRHPNIVTFRELVVQGDQVAMVLELLRGQDLHDRLAGWPLPVDTAVSVLEAMLDGLGYAHAAGVLHRNLKPRNVYWCDDGRIVILDFGIGRAADGAQAATLPHTASALDYLAPERVSGSGGTASSDVYAVGLVAWEMLTGLAAAPHGDAARKRMWHTVEGVGDAAQVAPTLRCPPWLADVIATLAAKDPAQRPANGQAALALLREKRAAAGATPASAPALRRPPLSTVLGPAPAGSARPAAAAVGGPPVGGPPKATGRGAPPGAGKGPSPSPSRSPSPSPPAPSPAPSAARAAAPTAAPLPGPTPRPAAPAGGVSKLALLAAAALVLAGGAWWRSRPGDAGPSLPVVVPAGATSTSFGYALAAVPAGTYTIGSPAGEAGRSENEAQHVVTLARGVLMGVTEVTQGQYQALMGTNPVVSPSECAKLGKTAVPLDDEPVYCVSWLDAAHLANAASAKEGLEACYLISGDEVLWPKGLACMGYRLPTESEWEVAARGGGSGIYAGGDVLSGQGWFEGNSGGRPHPVGQMAPNGYGLYDMSGNVWEWTWDIYEEAYPKGPVTDPMGAAAGSNRVLRGGSWDDSAQRARVAYRISNHPGRRYDFIGVRLARSNP